MKATILIAAMATTAAHAGSVVTDGVGMSEQSSGGFMNLSDDSLPMLAKGTQELGIGGSIDLSDGAEWDLNLTYGWFIMDNWELGFTVDWAGQDGNLLDSGQFGVFTEYNFATGTKFVPYVGLATTFASAGDRYDSVGTRIDGEDGVAFAGELGLKYFIRSHMAVYAGANFTWSLDDTLGVGDEIKDNITQLEVGMRFYF
ncbi:MAG: outer membrane beta-barrel protein [Verrucomicrobiota bacterium JB023]|nr:outer membrane beta-barrel protein [Verrucomicrobiota bacterium JB023]